MNYEYLKIIFCGLGFLYFSFSLFTKLKLKMRTDIYDNIYLYLDCILAICLIFIVFKLNQYIALLPLGLLLYNYVKHVPTDNYLWFSVDGISAGVLLCVASSLTSKGKLCIKN